MSSSQPAQELGLSAKARRTGEQPISFLMAAALGDPKLINFAAGLVDPLTLPVEATRQIVNTIFADDAGRGRRCNMTRRLVWRRCGGRPWDIWKNWNRNRPRILD